MSTTTEKVCEVCRITEVLPHPNADKLELAHFALKSGQTAYTCVIGKQQFKPGDLAVYVGVDAVVPLTGSQGERWSFLAKRLDGTGKEHYRIRAARLRGVYSEGILMEPPRGLLGETLMDKHLFKAPELGDEMWKEWGITFWEPPVKGTAFPAANPNKRIDQTLGGLFPEYGVESLKKAPFLFAEGDDVLITEKVHGSNLRAGNLAIGFFGTQKFVVGSHRCVKTDLRKWHEKLSDWLHNKLHKTTSYYGTDVWTRAAEKYQLQAKMKRWPDTVAYFELYGVTPEGKRIQDLTYGDVELGLVLLDAFDADTRTWLDIMELSHLSRELDVPLYKTLYKGPWQGLDAHKPLAEGKSTMPGASNIREGFVVHAPYDKRRGKFVGQGYLLRASADQEEAA